MSLGVNAEIGWGKGRAMIRAETWPSVLVSVRRSAGARGGLG
jgi:hypothetical protein